MAKRSRRAPFGLWLDANGYTPSRYAELAKRLKCSDGSIWLWARGGAYPRQSALRRLKALTGLSTDAFIFPFDKEA